VDTIQKTSTATPLPSGQLTTLFGPIWSGVLLLGLMFVLLSHLGYLPLDTRSDEPRRALVALEMILSGDYVTPTLNGDRYFNKPPLYNWVIAGSYHLFGNYSSLALRFPMIVSLLLFGLTVYYFVRKYLSAGVGFAVALMVLTNGRVLLYDSLLGLIEITFSWVVYGGMLLVFHFDRKRQYTLLYVTTYALTAIGFMLKGLPPVAFQGITLVGWFLYTRQIRRLFHPAHLLGIAVFMLITGSYYWVYFTHNAIPLSDVAGVLFNESAKRTGLQFGIGKTLLHLITFPFEVFYHFVPYLLLLVLLVRRGLWTVLKENAFVAFNALTFCTNVLIYWTSPQVYGRYLISLVPLLFTVLAYLYYEKTPLTNRPRWWVERIWLVLTVVLAVGCWATLFYPTSRTIPGVIGKTALVSGLLGILAWYQSRPSVNKLGLIAGVMIVTRLGINWLVLPGRFVTRQYYKENAERAVRATIGKPLYGYRTTVGNGQASDVSSFHISALRGDILRKTSRKLPGAYYVADSVNLVGERYDIIDKLVLFDRHPAYIVRFHPDLP
jgi:4-amino-4-deoxy-L-arabinose transferase-like glycosyltransferase